MSKIKIGQIGVCHEHAGFKMDALRKLPEVFEIVGVVDDRASPAARFGGSDLTPYDGLQWLTEEELFATSGLQAVMIETANADLVPTALRCMERNLAMHMDKPGGEDLEHFGRLLRGCEERKLPFQMGYMFRNNPAMQWCLQAVREEWLGEIFEVQGSMSHNYGGEAYQDFIGQFKGGMMFNLGCHLIDLVIAMLGRPQQVTPFLKSAPGFCEGIRNNCLTILEYSHAIATIRVCSLEVGGLDNRRLKLCGTKGTVELFPLERFDGQPLTMRLSLIEEAGGYTAGTHVLDFGLQRDRYADQLLKFVDTISGKTASPSTYDHDFLTQKVILAASGYNQWIN